MSPFAISRINVAVPSKFSQDYRESVFAPPDAGDILYFDGTNRKTLPIGAEGQVLSVKRPFRYSNGIIIFQLTFVVK